MYPRHCKHVHSFNLKPEVLPYTGCTSQFTLNITLKLKQKIVKLFKWIRCIIGKTCFPDSYQISMRINSQQLIIDESHQMLCVSVWTGLDCERESRDAWMQNNRIRFDKHAHLWSLFLRRGCEWADPPPGRPVTSHPSRPGPDSRGRCHRRRGRRDPCWRCCSATKEEHHWGCGQRCTRDSPRAGNSDSHWDECLLYTTLFETLH